MKIRTHCYSRTGKVEDWQKKANYENEFKKILDKLKRSQTMRTESLTLKILKLIFQFFIIKVKGWVCGFPHRTRNPKNFFDKIEIFFRLLFFWSLLTLRPYLARIYLSYSLFSFSVNLLFCFDWGFQKPRLSQDRFDFPVVLFIIPFLNPILEK